VQIREKIEKSLEGVNDFRVISQIPKICKKRTKTEQKKIKNQNEKLANFTKISKNEFSQKK